MENESFVKTSDLVKPIQHNHEKKEVHLNLLFRRMDKAFEEPFEPSKHEGDSSQSVSDPDMCAIPRKLPYSFIAEYDEIKDNPAVKAILIVATVLEKFKAFSYYPKDCFNLLRQIYKLVKDFHQLKDFPILHHLHKIKNADSDSVLTTALHALHSCFFAATFRGHDRVVLNQCAYKSEIRKQCNLVSEARRDLVTQMRVYILRYEERREREEKVQEEKLVLEENAASEAKGSKKKTVEEVGQDLNLDKPEQCAAVILRGQCSTHVGDAIYHHLKQSLLDNDFKYAKIEVAEGEEFLPDINKLRAPLLSVLEENETCIVNQFDLLRKSIFIYIDNLLSTQDLRSIFSSKLKHLKKLKLLVRSPNEGVSSALKEYGFKEPIVIKEVNVIINSGSKEKDHDKEKEHGEEKDHGQEKDHDKVNKEKDDMDKFALKHAFQNLPLTAQDAFLDICYFFVEWDWNEVSVIVGEDELQVLEANMWVKKNPSNRITVTDMLVDFGKSRDRGCSRITNGVQLKDELGKVKGLWLSTKDQTAVHILATTLEHMSGSLRILFLDGVTVEQVRDEELFPKLRFVHVDGCALPFHLKQLCNLNYLRCGDEDILSKASRLNLCISLTHNTNL